jgi:hypothetical protein
MLAVAIHEQHRAAAGMVEAGDEGCLLADSARAILSVSSWLPSST